MIRSGAPALMAWPVSKSYAQTGHYQDQPAGEPVESRYRMRRPEPEEATP